MPSLSPYPSSSWVARVALASALLSVSACQPSGDADMNDAEADVRPDASADPRPDASTIDDAGRDAPRPDAGAPDAGCDPDACGGPCGPCPPPPDDGCVALTAEDYENNEGNRAEFTAKFFPTDDRDNEYIDMFFRSDRQGTFRYGEGANADLYTCDQCMLIKRNDSFYYPTAGTITVQPGSEPLGRRLVATLSELRLVEIVISDSYHSIPVEGGECLTLAAASIDAR